MLDLESALKKVLSDVTPLTSETIAAEFALGRVLREPLLATSPIPRFDTSAMDGYALHAAGVVAGTVLSVIGEARTGLGQLDLTPGSAMRIFTGAALPLGADTVVMQERVQRQADQITLELAPKERDNVRRQGEDLEQGAVALGAGARVTPGTLMLAASLDQSEIVVSRRPRVTILCTGDELRAVGSPGGLGTIPESNSPGLRALAELAGAEATVAPLIADAPALLSDAVTKSLAECDLLVTVGGVSVGDHDYVRGALEAAGVQLGFWKVAIKPGKPLAFGRLEHRRVLALPGNPSSALVTFALFGLPLLRALQQDNRCTPLGAKIPCAVAVRRNSERLILSLGTLVEEDGTSAFLPHRNQSSGATVALAASDGLALIAPGDSMCEKGTLLQFLSWSSL